MKRLAGAIAVMLFLTGCGVPVQDDPMQVQPEVVPSQLRPQATPQTQSPSTADPSKPKALIHFVRADRLVALTRDVPAGSVEDRLNAVLAALVVGPTEEELARGVASALPEGLQLKVLSVDGPEVVLELSGETDGRSATENVLAVGQIVLSVTSVRPVTKVRLARDGRPVEALLADGALTAEPLTAADYAELRTG